MAKKRTTKWLLIILTLVILWVGIAPLLANRLIIEKKLENADVIFVLAGSAYYLERTARAAIEYHAGVSRQILLSDDGLQAGWSSSEQRNPRFIELTRRALIERGVEPSAISVLSRKVSGTADEARQLATKVKENEWDSVLIVTSAYHSRRALYAFERQLEGSDIEIGIVSPPPGEQTPSENSWWLTVDGWWFIGGEYTKGIWYRISSEYFDG